VLGEAWQHAQVDVVGAWLAAGKRKGTEAERVALEQKRGELEDKISCGWQQLYRARDSFLSFIIIHWH
jgi:hypothetical protein